MDKDKLLIGYLDFYLSNAKLDDETFIQNEYDRYSEKIGRIDPLREHLFGLKNLLFTKGFIKEVEPNMFYLTEKGIEAKLSGGYYKYLKAKNKLNKYQFWALALSMIAILFTTYNTFFKNQNTILSLEKKVDSLNVRFDSLVQSNHTRAFDSLNEGGLNRELRKKGK